MLVNDEDSGNGGKEETGEDIFGGDFGVPCWPREQTSESQVTRASFSPPFIAKFYVIFISLHGHVDLQKVAESFGDCAIVTTSMLAQMIWECCGDF